MLLVLPLLLLPLLAYNVFLLAGGLNPWELIVLRADLWSGDRFTLSLGEGLLGVGVLLLGLDLVRAGRQGRRARLEALLAGLVVLAYAAEFALVPEAGTSTFVLLGLMALVSLALAPLLGRRHGARELFIEPRAGVRQNSSQDGRVEPAGLQKSVARQA